MSLGPLMNATPYRCPFLCFPVCTDCLHDVNFLIERCHRDDALRLRSADRQTIEGGHCWWQSRCSWLRCGWHHATHLLLMVHAERGGGVLLLGWWVYVCRICWRCCGVRLTRNRCGSDATDCARTRAASDCEHATEEEKAVAQRCVGETREEREERVGT